MANQEHLEVLRQGVETWNEWRMKRPERHPDLSEADLSGAFLIMVDLNRATLCDTNLIKAHLSGADLSRPTLYGADCIKAILRDADLYLQDEIQFAFHSTLTRVWSRKGRRGQRLVEAPGDNRKAYGFGPLDWRDGWMAESLLAAPQMCSVSKCMQPLPAHNVADMSPS